jgi:hypothetical protein
VAGLLSEPERIIAGLDSRIERERQRLRLDPAREEKALLDRRGALEEERKGYLRQNARGVISDAELDEMLLCLEEIRQEIDRSLEQARGHGEYLRVLTETRRAYAEPTAWARDHVDGWIRAEQAEGTVEPESEDEYEAQVAMLAGD